MRCLPSWFFIFIFLQWANLIGPSLEKNEIMEAPQNRMFILQYRVPPLWPSYRGGKDDICQSIWDKSEVLLGTFWEHVKELGNSLLWTSPPTQRWKEGRPLHSLMPTSHWLHGNFIHKIGCHYFWPGLIALPKNTLPIQHWGSNGLSVLLYYPRIRYFFHKKIYQVSSTLHFLTYLDRDFISPCRSKVCKFY